MHLSDIGRISSRPATIVSFGLNPLQDSGGGQKSDDRVD